jgi:hypothetical protein
MLGCSGVNGSDNCKLVVDFSIFKAQYQPSAF